MLRRILLRASHSDWLERKFTRGRVADIAVRRFLPGEGLDDAVRATNELAASSIGTVLTRLGENTTSSADADEVADHYRQVIDRIIRDGLNSQVSVKLTQLGLDIGPCVAADRLGRIVQHAMNDGVFVWVDMEDSSYTDATFEIFRDLHSRLPNIGVCVQSYLRRTRADVEGLLSAGATLRLVKGAYNESRSTAYPRKRDVDATYLLLAEMLLDNANKKMCPAFGTHDMRLINRIQGLARERSLDPSFYEIQMLYGIRRSDQLRLAREGDRVRILVSYGDRWFPWYMRRLAERPANVMFVMKSLLTR